MFFMSITVQMKLHPFILRQAQDERMEFHLLQHVLSEPE